MMHNKALQPTANPLRGLSAAELGRYVSDGRSDAHGQPGHSADRVNSEDNRKGHTE